MKTTRFFLLALLTASSLLAAQAQTASPSFDSTTNGAPGVHGPVVLPPADRAPSAPEPAPASTSAATTPPTLSSPAQVSAPGAPKDEIYDIRPPLFFLRSWLWLWIVLAVAAALAFLIFIWRWFASRSVLNPKTAYDLALERLDQARGLLNEQNPGAYGVAVSEAVRTYLGQRFLTPSTRSTTDEFLRRMEADPAAPLAQHRDLLRDFLQSCDLLKFARYQPSLAELEQIHERAVRFVTATKPVPVGPAPQPDLLPRAA